jgi:3-oxoacyl-[acyl-carrier protein] reductase
MAVNLRSAFLCSRSAALIMRKQGEGKIINITSGLGQMPFPRFCAYGVSKAGVIQMTRSLAEELREFGIQVNAIDPGVMNTKMQEEVRSLGPSVLGPAIHDRFVLYKARGELKAPSLVASVAVFLASSEADHLSGYVAGLDQYKALGWRP